MQTKIVPHIHKGLSLHHLLLFENTENNQEIRITRCVTSREMSCFWTTVIQADS